MQIKVLPGSREGKYSSNYRVHIESFLCLFVAGAFVDVPPSHRSPRRPCWESTIPSSWLTLVDRAKARSALNWDLDWTMSSWWWSLLCPSFQADSRHAQSKRFWNINSWTELYWLELWPTFFPASEHLLCRNMTCIERVLLSPSLFGTVRSLNWIEEIEVSYQCRS